MKRFRLVALFVTFVMICATMSGCVYNDTAVTINEDGTGSIVVTAGVEQSVAEAMMYMDGGTSSSNSMSSSLGLGNFGLSSSTGSGLSLGSGISFGGLTTGSSMSHNNSFDLGGFGLSNINISGSSSSGFASMFNLGDMDLSDATLTRRGNRSYYTVNEKYDFKNPQEFANIIRETLGCDAGYGLANSQFSDNVFWVCFNFVPSMYTVESLFGQSVSAKDYEMLADAMYYNLTVTLPSRAYLTTSQPIDGVTIKDGNTVTFDLLKMGESNIDELVQCLITLEPINEAVENTQTVLVNGNPVLFETYALIDANGGETNYIKLRDLAYVLRGTDAQFEIVWDGTIDILSDRAYTPNGSEMFTPFSGNRPYRVADAVTKINGVEVKLDAICLEDDNGGEYNYYKLRDIGKLLNFDVSWSSAKGIYIETDQPYTDD